VRSLPICSEHWNKQNRILLNVIAARGLTLCELSYAEASSSALHMSILCSSKIGFSWITLPNRPGRNFTQWWGLRWDASLETLGDLSQRRPKCHFSAADLREIWRQHVNWCGHQSFRKGSEKFLSEKGSLTPQNRFFEVCFCGYLVISLYRQTEKFLSKNDRSIFTVKGPRMCLCRVTFGARVAFSH